MNARRPILVGVVLVIALVLALIVFRPKTARQAAPPTERIETESTEPAAAPPKRVLAQMPESIPPESDVPIVFYGKLEDQGGQPVVEAEITGTTIFHKGAGAPTRLATTSDANGLFTLNMSAGESLEVMPRKAGYALASTNNVQTCTSSASETHPDPNNPVIIKMWKLQGAEPLVAINRQYQIPYTNAPMFFDFITQEIVPSGGDVKITVLRWPDSVSTAYPQGWHVEIEGIDGGALMQISMDKWKTTYWAPADGYAEKIVLPMVEDASQNWESLDGMFFVRTREGGVYTKLAVKITMRNARDSLINLDLRGIANTNGSCNWEGDPATLQFE